MLYLWAFRTSGPGRVVARRHGVRMTPTVIVFGAGRRERYRQSGFPDLDRLEAEALNPL